MNLTTKQIIIHFRTKLLFLEANYYKKYERQERAMARLTARVNKLEVSQCQTK